MLNKLESSLDSLANTESSIMAQQAAIKALVTYYKSDVCDANIQQCILNALINSSNAAKSMLRSAVLSALGQLILLDQKLMPVVEPVILNAFSDEEYQVREKAAAVIEKNKQPTAAIRQAVLTAVADENEWVRRRAINVMSNWTELDDGASAILQNRLRDGFSWVREAAAYASHKLLNPSQELKEQLVVISIRDPDSKVKQAASLTLEEYRVRGHKPPSFFTAVPEQISKNDQSTVTPKK